jgi:hypothetical protein
MTGKRDNGTRRLPKIRNRPHAFGAPAVDEFYETIAKARRRAAARRKVGG